MKKILLVTMLAFAGLSVFAHPGHKKHKHKHHKKMEKKKDNADASGDTKPL